LDLRKAGSGRASNPPTPPPCAVLISFAGVATEFFSPAAIDNCFSRHVPGTTPFFFLPPPFSAWSFLKNLAYSRRSFSGEADDFKDRSTALPRSPYLFPTPPPPKYFDRKVSDCSFFFLSLNRFIPVPPSLTRHCFLHVFVWRLGQSPPPPHLLPPPPAVVPSPVARTGSGRMVLAPRAPNLPGLTQTKVCVLSVHSFLPFVPPPKRECFCPFHLTALL